MSAKQRFANVFEREHATTRRVLHSLPASKSEFMPYPDAPVARVVAAKFSQSQWRIALAMSGQWQWPPIGKPGATNSYEEVLALFDETGAAAMRAMAEAPENRLDEMIPFFRGPQRIEPLPVSELVWFMLMRFIIADSSPSTFAPPERRCRAFTALQRTSRGCESGATVSE